MTLEKNTHVTATEVLCLSQSASKIGRTSEKNGYINFDTAEKNRNFFEHIRCRLNSNLVTSVHSLLRIDSLELPSYVHKVMYVAN